MHRHTHISSVFYFQRYGDTQNVFIPSCTIPICIVETGFRLFISCYRRIYFLYSFVVFPHCEKLKRKYAVCGCRCLFIWSNKETTSEISMVYLYATCNRERSNFILQYISISFVLFFSLSFSFLWFMGSKFCKRLNCHASNNFFLNFWAFFVQKDMSGDLINLQSVFTLRLKM